jgi:hypothetical protein
MSPRFRPSLELLEDRCLLSVNTTTQVAGPNIDVSNLAGYQGETTIAINPTNPLNMIAGSNTLSAKGKKGGGNTEAYWTKDGGNTEAYWTKDGGNTWSAVNLGGLGDPGVAFDRSGNAYFSFIDSNYGISVRKSTNGGKTWSRPVEVAAPPPGAPYYGIQDKPAITVGPDHANPSQDRVYVAWDDNAASDVLQVASSGNGGNTWTAPVSVDGNGYESYAQPAVGPDGRFYIAWDNFANSSGSQIMFSSSLNDGSTFSSPVVAAASTINLFIPTRYTIPAQPSRGIAADPSMSVEQSGTNAGRIYMTYTSAPTSHDDTNIYLVASDDGGATWTALGSSPVQVNDDTTTTSQFFSAIGIDPTNGTVDLAWYDARNDTTNNQKVDVYFQSYSSAGVASGPNVKVTTAPSDESDPNTNNPNQYGDYMGIAASGGFAFPVWTDHRNSTVSGSEEIYVDPPLPIPGVAPAATLPSAPQDAALATLGTGTGASLALGAVPLADLPFWGSSNDETAPITNIASSWLALSLQLPSLGNGSTAASTPTASQNAGIPAVPDARSADDLAARMPPSQGQTAGVLEQLFAQGDAAFSSDGSGDE